MGWQVRFHAREDATQPLTWPDLTFTPLSFSRTARWDADRAVIGVRGSVAALNRLAGALLAGVEVFDAQGRLAWNGVVWELVVQVGRLRYGVTAAGMANRVQVRYLAAGPVIASSPPAVTAWADDAASQAQFGVLARVLRLGAVSASVAESYRDRVLAEQAQPVVRAQLQASVAEVGQAWLTCRGWSHLLGLDYAPVASGAAGGLLAHTLDVFPGEQVLNRARTADTLRFEASSGRVIDSSNSLALTVGTALRVSGSASNDGVYSVVAVGRGDWAQLSPGVANESAGASITLAWRGAAVAQPFELDSASLFRAGEVQVRVRRVGWPSASLTVAVCADSGGEPGAVLGSGSLPTESVPPQSSWLRLSLTPQPDLSAGTPYWLVVSTNGGGPSVGDYYLVSLDESASAAGGEAWLEDGGGWSARSTSWGAASLLYRVLGLRETTAQIAALAAGALGEVWVREGSGQFTWPYRAGPERTRTVIDELLAGGVADGRGLRLRVGAGRQAWVEPLAARPAAGMADLRLQADGTLTRRDGSPFAAHLCPAGEWVAVQPALAVAASADWRLSPVLIETCEFDVARGRLVRLVTAGDRDGLDLLAAS